MKEVYIIRNGYGNTFYDFEFLWFLLCILLSVISWRRRYQSYADYGVVLLVGSIYWAVAETILFSRGTRDGQEDGLVDEFVLFGWKLSGGVLPGIMRGIGEGGEERPTNTTTNDAEFFFTMPCSLNSILSKTTTNYALQAIYKPSRLTTKAMVINNIWVATAWMHIVSKTCHIVF